jgi:hypothetical protein
MVKPLKFSSLALGGITISARRGEVAPSNSPHIRSTRALAAIFTMTYTLNEDWAGNIENRLERTVRILTNGVLALR